MGVHIEHVFVINLKNRPDRWENIQDNFKDTNLKLKRWDATYGKDLSEKEIADITSDFCNKFCSYGMIGCWMSHYNLWKYIAEHNLNNVLILEDDAKPQSNFNEINNKLKNIPEDYDLIYLGCFGSCDQIGDNIVNIVFNKKNKDLYVNGIKHNDLIIPSMPLGAHAYLLSNKGANKLINHKELKKVRYHIDYALSDLVYNKNDFNVYAFKEPFIMQSSDINASDLVTNEHPIISIPLSKIYISDNYNLDYILNAQLFYIRNLSVPVTGLTIIFASIAFLIGLSHNKDLMLYFAYFMLVLYIAESYIKRKIHINALLFEMLMIIIFLYLGNNIYS